MKSRMGAVAQLLFVDLLGSIAWYLIWWYTKGLQKVVRAAIQQLEYRFRSYAFGIWIRNFFVPMYGQYDWSGRLISVFMRFFVILGRGIAIVFESLVYAAGVVLWIIAPPAALLLALYSGTAGIAGDRIPLIQEFK
ncbi:MAG: hypothetical protein AMXMBFR16_03720 [Candidatus Uhrbacteria bacterium]